MLKTSNNNFIFDPKKIALQAKELVFGALFKNTPIAFYWMDNSGIFQGCNKEELKILGIHSLNELIGKHSNDIALPSAWENSQKIMADNITQIMEETHVNSKNEQTIFLSIKSPINDDDGNIVGLIGISLDITDYKRKEMLEKEKTAAEQKVRDLRILAGTIAHELRNPLGAITLQYDLIESALTTVIKNLLENNSVLYDKLCAEHFIQVFEAGRQINDVIRYTTTTIDLLLNNIREEEINTTKFKQKSILADIKHVIDSFPFIKDEKQKIHYNTNTDFQYWGNPNLVCLVLTNLLKNALYHVRLANKGEIYITSRENKDKNYLIFRDTGPGIPEKILPKIFERFVTGRAGGTGLGLTFCKMVMQAMRGDITCNSKQGEFTEFILSFTKINLI